MTEKQRAISAFRGEQPERDCVFPLIDVCYAAKQAGVAVGDCFANPELHAAALEQALNCHPKLGGVYVNICLTPRTYSALGGGRYRDAGGMLWSVPQDDVGTVREREITKLDDPRLQTENPLMDGILDTYKAISPICKEKFLVIPGLTGPFSQIVFMLGLEETLLLMYDEPEKLHAALEHRTHLALAWAERLAHEGAQAVWIGEGAASSSILSPDMYREFVLPYAARVVRRLRELDVFSVMHVCGDIRPSADIIAQTGADAMDIDHMVPMRLAREKAGGTICLKGNLNPVALQNGPAQEVERMCAEILAQTTRPRMLGTGCLVTRDTPPEYLDAMVEAAEKAARN